MSALGLEMRPLHRATERALDKGIRHAVRVLYENGVETFESCEGGKGHAYAEPTIRFYGTLNAGWAALTIAHDHGVPVYKLGIVYSIQGGQPHGPFWEMTLSRKDP